MNATPMYTRCAVYQWHGLTEATRANIDTYIALRDERGDPGCVLGWAEQAQVGYPIWTVATPDGSLIDVLAVKVDA